jgi:hypothetical protein
VRVRWLRNAFNNLQAEIAFVAEENPSAGIQRCLLLGQILAEKTQRVVTHHRSDFCGAEPFLKKRSRQFREMRRVERHRNAAVEVGSQPYVLDPYHLHRVSDGTRDGSDVPSAHLPRAKNQCR